MSGMRTALPLLALLPLFAPLASAEEGVQEAYKKLKALKGEERQKFAAEQAAAFDGKVQGRDMLYLGFLFFEAEMWDKAAPALKAFLDVAKGDDAMRPVAASGWVDALVEAKRYGEVEAAAQAAAAGISADKYVGKILWNVARSRRAQGRLAEAAVAFEQALQKGHEDAAADLFDARVALGQYDQARELAKTRAAAETKGSTWKTISAMAANLGKPIPDFNFDYWAGGDRSMADLKSKPTVYVFWSTMAQKVLPKIHKTAAHWNNQFQGKAFVIGPAVYLKFDPIEGKPKEGATREEEQAWVKEWVNQYQLPYPLGLVADGGLHEFFGVHAEKPHLPAFAMSDKSGIYRYFRLGGDPYDREAAELALTRLASE